MSNKKGVSFDTLMKHMRQSGIQVNGSKQKRQLMLSGYYHGYKGYRYRKTPSCRIPFSNYNQIQAVIDFDEAMKALLYRPVMQLETAMKSIVTDVVIRLAKTDSFYEIMDRLMHASGHKDKKGYIQRKNKMRDTIYVSLTEAYSRGNIVKHYYHKDSYVPIWAVFEVITLGQFAVFIELLDAHAKLAICQELDFNIPIQYNTNGTLLPSIMYAIRDLRNTIAHNGAVFDARYRSRDIPQNFMKWLECETAITNITFQYLIDDIILVFLLMKRLKFKKISLYSQVRDILKLTGDLFEIIGAPGTVNSFAQIDITAW